MTAATLTRDALIPRNPDGLGRGLGLALLVHSLLLVALAFSVNWRSSNPAGVEAELWAAVPQIAAPRAVEPEPTPQPQPKKVEPPPPPPKVEEPPKPKALPKPVVKVDTPKPPTPLPPPPNEPPPEQPPAKPVPVVVGLSLSSTTSGGSFAVPTGNTLMGKSDTKAVNPADVKPYAAPKYVPAGSADRDPELAQEVKIPYPEEARKAGVEGSVRMKILVDASGVVSEVTVLSGPGYGLNEAARDAVKKFKFRPALKAGEPVGTTMIYTYTFLLD